MRTTTRFLAAALTLWPALALAVAFQSPESIRNAAISALGQNGVQAEASVDSQLSMPACRQPLQAAVTGPASVAVRCADNPGWQVYVPVRVRREADVVVLTRPVRGDEPIAADQVAVQRREVGESHDGALRDASALVGKRLRKAMPAGAVVTSDDLGDAAALRRGDPVTLVSRAGGMEVRMSGRALGPARMGSTVSVENTGSRRIIRGRLVGPGLVEVNL